MRPPSGPSPLQAYAAARFAESVLLGLNGEQDVVECAYVESTLVPGLTYFASKVRWPRCQLCVGWLDFPLQWPWLGRKAGAVALLQALHAHAHHPNVALLC